MKMIQIYAKKLPSTWIETIRYGKITYWDFLCKEKESMERHNRKVTLKGGEIAKGLKHTNCCLYADKLF